MKLLRTIPWHHDLFGLLYESWIFQQVKFPQVKSLSINFGGSKHGKIKMFHDYDMTKSPVVELTPHTYSAVRKSISMIINL